MMHFIQTHLGLILVLLILVIILIIVFIVQHNKNAHLLTEEEKISFFK